MDCEVIKSTIDTFLIVSSVVIVYVILHVTIRILNSHVN